MLSVYSIRVTPVIFYYVNFVNRFMDRVSFDNNNMR